MVSQLYVQLDDYISELLVLRLEETATGFGVAVVRPSRPHFGTRRRSWGGAVPT
jgi:hypothetical protein